MCVCELFMQVLMNDSCWPKALEQLLLRFLAPYVATWRMGLMMILHSYCTVSWYHISISIYIYIHNTIFYIVVCIYIYTYARTTVCKLYTVFDICIISYYVHIVHSLSSKKSPSSWSQDGISGDKLRVGVVNLATSGCVRLGCVSNVCCCIHWIGLRDNLQENPIFIHICWEKSRWISG